MIVHQQQPTPAATSAPQASARGGKPLRIALVTETYPPEVNGVAMTLGRLSRGLLNHGHQLQVIRPQLPENYQNGCPSRVAR